MKETGVLCGKRMREEGRGWQRKEGKRALTLSAVELALIRRATG